MKVVWPLVGGVLAVMLGCQSPQTTRSQSDDAEVGPPPSEPSLIGEATAFANVEPIPISGVGLVYGLDGTGHSPPGEYRRMLERDLKKAQVEDVQAILDSPNQCMVLVSGVIPAGARKGDSIDLQVTLPQGSKATSLRGGKLASCQLYSYSSARALSDRYAASGAADQLKLGHTLAQAEGPLMMRLPEPQAGRDPAPGDELRPEEDDETTAVIWEGGRCKLDRELYLTLNPDQQRALLAARIANRINQTFHGLVIGADRYAVAKTKEHIVLKVPAQYRLNTPRFMRVVRMIPIRLPAERSAYRFNLEEQVLDPATTMTAALKLEALGPDSIPMLRRGLQHASPLVRFATAEALAYLGEAEAAKELANLCQESPLLEAYCLTALASLGDRAARLHLARLLEADAPTVRYGAFRALREMDSQGDPLNGEQLGDAFWLHEISSDHGPAFVHLLGSGRAEVTIFGNAPAFQVPFSYLVGPEFTVTAKEGDQRCTISRFSLKGKDRRQCSFAVADIVRTMAAMGASYIDIVHLMRQADMGKVLNCPLHFDALPQGISVPQLAKLGQDYPDALPKDLTAVEQRSSQDK